LAALIAEKVTSYRETRQQLVAHVADRSGSVLAIRRAGLIFGGSRELEARENVGGREKRPEAERRCAAEMYNKDS